MRQSLDLRQSIGAATEPIGELGQAGALLTPAEHPPLERTQSTVTRTTTFAAGQAGEIENTVDVIGAAPEAARQLRLVDTLVRQAQQAPFERPQPLNVNSHAGNGSGI